MALQVTSSFDGSSPVREKEREKEEEISLEEKTEGVAEAVFSGIEERGSPELLPIDRVVSIRRTPNQDLIRSIENGSAGIYTRMLGDIKSNQINERYRANGEVTIQAFMKFEEVRKEFESGNRESYKELIAFFNENGLGFHEENYEEVKGVFSPEMFLGSADATAQILSYIYGHARREHLLPIFFQLALSDGGCFQARSRMIMEYGSLIERADVKKELLKTLVKIFSDRYSGHKLPVDLDAFVDFVNGQTGLSLSDFGVDCQNPREDELVRELTTKNYFTSQGGVDLIGEAFGHFAVWMSDASGGRKSFIKYIREQMNEQLTGAQKTKKAMEKLVDQMIAAYPEYPLNDYLTEERAPVIREARENTPVDEDISADFLFGAEDE